MFLHPNVENTIFKIKKPKKPPSDLGGNKSPIPGVKPYVYD